ncbi:hypothetical protein HDU96_007476 [Phlyctochytrium bullatum]|nr:hypothetical protein HDU96_007476 [Phlyctochytrium bullatum]
MSMADDNTTTFSSKPPPTVAILGAGLIGSYVGLSLALSYDACGAALGDAAGARIHLVGRPRFVEKRERMYAGGEGFRVTVVSPSGLAAPCSTSVAACENKCGSSVPPTRVPEHAFRCHGSLEALVRSLPEGPDFLVVTVKRGDNAAVARELARCGFSAEGRRMGWNVSEESEGWYWRNTTVLMMQNGAGAAASLRQALGDYDEEQLSEAMSIQASVSDSSAMSPETPVRDDIGSMQSERTALLTPPASPPTAIAGDAFQEFPAGASNPSKGMMVPPLRLDSMTGTVLDVHDAVIFQNVVEPEEGWWHVGSLGGGCCLPEVGEGKTRWLAWWLRRTGIKCEVEEDVEGVVYGKLLINLVNAISALSSLTLRSVMLSEPHRKILAMCQLEALQVYRAAGIVPTNRLAVPVDLLPWYMMLPNEVFELTIDKVFGINEKASCSMYEDIRHGRKTEIEFFQGEISRLGRLHGIQTTVCDRVSERLMALERERVGFVPHSAEEIMWGKEGLKR